MNSCIGLSYLPPTSEPIPKIEAPDAMIDPSPPEEPPHIRPGWYGFTVLPYTLHVIYSYMVENIIN